MRGANYGFYTPLFLLWKFSCRHQLPSSKMCRCVYDISFLAKHANGWQQFVWWGFWLNNNPELALVCTRQKLTTKHQPFFQANNQLYDIPSITKINQGYIWVIFVFIKIPCKKLEYYSLVFITYYWQYKFEFFYLLLLIH